MAAVLRYNLNVQAENGLFKRDIQAPSRSVDLNAQGHAAGIMEVTTADEGVAMDIGDIETPGFLYMRNLDETNFVFYGPDAAGALVPFGWMNPGEEAWLRLYPGATLRIAADTTTVLVQYEVFSD